MITRILHVRSTATNIAIRLQHVRTAVILVSIVTLHNHELCAQRAGDGFFTYVALFLRGAHVCARSVRIEASRTIWCKVSASNKREMQQILLLSFLEIQYAYSTAISDTQLRRLANCRAQCIKKALLTSSRKVVPCHLTPTREGGA